jgi:hypothetical protein
MDSTRQGLSNGILFVKFRRRLSAFPFFGLFSRKKLRSAEKKW